MLRGPSTALILALTLAWAHPAAAQSIAPTRSSRPAPRLSLEEYERELAGIEESATIATVLYVTGVVLHVGGLGAFVGGIAASVSLYGPSPRGDWGAPLATVGLAAAILGVVLIIIGATRDGESARRRRHLGPRPRLTWAGALDGDGASLACIVF